MAQRRAVTKANATRYKPADKARTGPRCLPPRDLAWSASADGPFPPNKACPNLTLRAPLSVHVFRTVRQPRRVAHPPPTAPTDRSGQQNTYLLCITCVFARPSISGAMTAVAIAVGASRSCRACRTMYLLGLSQLTVGMRARWALCRRDLRRGSPTAGPGVDAESSVTAVFHLDWAEFIPKGRGAPNPMSVKNWGIPA